MGVAWLALSVLIGLFPAAASSPSSNLVAAVSTACDALADTPVPADAVIGGFGPSQFLADVDGDGHKDVVTGYWTGNADPDLADHYLHVELASGWGTAILIDDLAQFSNFPMATPGRVVDMAGQRLIVTGVERNADGARVGAVRRGEDPILNAAVDEQHAALTCTTRPLVRASRVEVGVDLAKIDIEQAERLGAVEQGDHAARFGSRADLLGREEVANGVGEMRKGEDLGPCRHRLAERVDVVIGPWMRVLLLDDTHRETKPLRLFHPRLVVAGMVVAEDHDLVSSFELQAVGHEVVRFARVTCNDDFFGRHAQKSGERLARVLFGAG